MGLGFKYAALLAPLTNVDFQCTFCKLGTDTSSASNHICKKNFRPRLEIIEDCRYDRVRGYYQHGFFT